jgi:hypothetical protein
MRRCKAHALHRAQLVVERFADQGVRETIATRCIGDLDQNPRLHRFVEPFEETIDRCVGRGFAVSRENVYEFGLASNSRPTAAAIVRA